MNFILLACLFFTTSNAAVIDLSIENLNSTLNTNKLALVDFYAPWCYFSNLLDPIFLEASNILEKEYKNNGTVVFGKVNCENQDKLCKQYGIRKYPTVKVFQFGELSKREYRGARNSLAFVQYIKQRLVDPIVYLNGTMLINKEISKSYVIGYFREKSGSNFQIFRKAANQLREDCNFVALISPNLSVENFTVELAQNKVREINGNLTDSFNDFKYDIMKSCVPPVRNITFQNAEDIIEENRPLVLLFYHPTAPEYTVRFMKFVTDHLMSYTNSVNFVYADGHRFSHPIKHFGKSEQDLPFFVIDSLQHMFLLSHSTDNVLENPQIMKNYISDLHSGKLHREFHNSANQVLNNQKSQDEIKVMNTRGSEKKQAIPMSSVFKKLKPNSNRYTLFHDEF